MRETLYKHVLDLLRERHVEVSEMAQIVYDGQVKYEPDITLDKCKQAILHGKYMGWRPVTLVTGGKPFSSSSGASFLSIFDEFLS